jgi:hypothetical protein
MPEYGAHCILRQAAGRRARRRWDENNNSQGIPMSRIEWRVDKGTHIVLSKSLFSSRQVELNGQPVDGEWSSKRFAFTLADGRPAEIVLRADALSRETDLTVDGRLIPDTRYVPKDLRCPGCNAEIQLLDEFCAKCGRDLGTPARFIGQRSVQGATSAIRLLAALFAIFGIIMFFVMRGTTQQVLDNLAQFPDHEILQPIDGVTYTAGELRRRVVWEHRGLLIVNLGLSAIMLVLAWWSRFKPLAAILIATAIYAAVQVVSAIMDPATIMQGLVVKILVIAILVRGIKGALSVRTDNG